MEGLIRPLYFKFSQYFENALEMCLCLREYIVLSVCFARILCDVCVCVCGVCPPIKVLTSLIDLSLHIYSVLHHTHTHTLKITPCTTQVICGRVDQDIQGRGFI